MSLIEDVVLFSAILATNLLLVGSLAVGSLSVSFPLLGNISPRARYVISVAAFMAAVLFPLTLSVVDSPARIPAAAARQKGPGGSPSEVEGVMNGGAAARGLTGGGAAALSAAPGAFAVAFANSAFAQFFFALWVTGALYLILLEVNAHRRLRAAIKTWKPATESERREFLCPEGVPMYFDEDERPGTVGLFNPAVVLPTGIHHELPLDAVRHIVRHEAAHARWRDPLVNSILRLTRAIFWVCPALWLLERHARAEREAAADHAVISESSANGAEFEAMALSYAATLLAAAKLFNSYGPREYYNPQTTRIGGGGSGLESRVRRLLNYSARPGRARVAFAAMIATSSLSAMTFMPLASRPPVAGAAPSVQELKTPELLRAERAGQIIFDEAATEVSEEKNMPGREFTPRGRGESFDSSRKPSQRKARGLGPLDTRLQNLNRLEAVLGQLGRLESLNGR